MAGLLDPLRTTRESNACPDQHLTEYRYAEELRKRTLRCVLAKRELFDRGFVLPPGGIPSHQIHPFYWRIKRRSDCFNASLLAQRRC